MAGTPITASTGGIATRVRPRRRTARHHRAGWAFSAPRRALFLIAIVVPPAYAMHPNLLRDRLVEGDGFAGLANHVATHTRQRGCTAAPAS